MTASPVPAAPFRTRNVCSTDYAFLFSSFLRTMRDEPVAEHIGNDAFYGTWKRAFEDVLATFDVLVAHPVGDEDEIAGYIAWKARTLGFLYVKRDPWRRMGVARLLLDASGLSRQAGPVAVLFPTERGRRLAKLKGFDIAACSHLGALALTARAQ